MKTLCKIEDKVTYQGQVTLSIMLKNNKKIDLIEYNHALPKLSEVFAKAMCGYNVFDSIPKYLMAKKVTSRINMLTYPALLTGSNYVMDSDGYYYVSYNALITNSMLAPIDSNVDEAVCFVLVDSLNNELVQLNLLDANGAEVTSLSSLVGEGKNLLVNWKLKLTNNDDYIPEE